MIVCNYRGVGVGVGRCEGLDSSSSTRSASRSRHTAPGAGVGPDGGGVLRRPGRRVRVCVVWGGPPEGGIWVV